MLRSRSALGTVFTVILTDLLGFGIVLPLLPFYAAQFNAGPALIGLLYSVYSLAQLFFSPLWGGLSDRIGRRPVMLASTFGSAASYILFAFSGSLTALFVSRALAGVMGGNIAAAQAYITDVTPPQERARGMGLIGAAFGIGFAVGPAAASLLIQPGVAGGILELFSKFHLSPGRFALPGLFAALLSATSFLLVLFKLPESRTPGRRAASVPKRAGVFSPDFRRLVAGGAGTFKGLLPLLGCGFILSVGHSSLYGAFPLYCQRTLGLGADIIGLQYAWMGFLAVLIQGGLIRPLAARWGETRLFFAGSVLMTTGLALLPFGGSALAFGAALGIMAVGGSLNGPTLTSLVSKRADPSAVGMTMGVSQSISGLGRVVGPAWGGILYGIRPDLPFFLTAALVSATAFAGARMLRRGD